MARDPDQQLVAAGEDLLVRRMGHTDYTLPSAHARELTFRAGFVNGPGSTSQRTTPAPNVALQ
jgi:hypothetical protein